MFLILLFMTIILYNIYLIYNIINNICCIIIYMETNKPKTLVTNTCPYHTYNPQVAMLIKGLCIINNLNK